jgi:hypothetical protein
MDGVDLKSEVVVIMGASAGLGRATAREFGRRGVLTGMEGRCGLIRETFNGYDPSPKLC